MALDIKEIQELIKFVAKSGVSEVDLEMGEMKISIKNLSSKENQLIQVIKNQTYIQI